MSTTNEPDLTQVLAAIKLLVTSEGPITEHARHFTERLEQVCAVLPNLEVSEPELIGDMRQMLPSTVLHVDTCHWTVQLSVTGAALIRHVTRIVRAREGVNPSVPVLSLPARNMLRRLSELLCRTALVPHLSKYGKSTKDSFSATQPSFAALLHVLRAFIESISAAELWSEIQRAVLSDMLTGVIHVTDTEHVPDCTDQDMTRVKQWSAAQLEYVIEHVPVTDLAEQLFILLKLASAQSPPVPHVTRQIGTILSRLLLRPGGLFGVLTPILTAKNVSPASYLQAARIVTAVPRQLTAAEYFAQICPQVRQLLTVRGPDACHFASCAVSVVTLLLQQHREHVMQYLLREIMRPFTEFMKQFDQETSHVTPTRGLISLNSASTSVTRVIVSHAELVQSVTELHELLTRHVTPVMCEVVTPVFPALFGLFAALYRVSKRDSDTEQLLTRVKEMLVTWANAVESSELTRVLQIIVIDLPRKTDCLKWQYRFEARVTDQGTQCSLVRVESASLVEYSVEAQCVIDMLTGVNNKSAFIGDYFVQILHLLIDQLKEARDSGELNSFLLSLLGLMCEQFKDSIFSNVVQILTFLRVLIDQCVDSVAEHVTDTQHEHVIDEEMLQIALTILDTMLHSGRTIDRAEELLLFDLVAPLRLIGQFPRESLASSATALHDKIVNRDISWAQTSDSTGSVNDNSVNALESALRDLNDPLLPVRAHGLIALRRLVLARDPHTMQHMTRVIEIFRTQLQDDDSYVYLGAIRGFSALGDVEFDTVVPLMRELFLEYQTGNEKKPKIEVIGAHSKNKSFTEAELTKRLEVRLKIGEAFLQIAQRLGEALPKYAATLVPIFLAGCRDADPLMRASALSNLAELCELLHYALLPYLEEIVSCAQSLLQSDTTVEVRRGVINLYAQLLTGLEDEVFEVMPHHLRTIYSTLKHVQTHDEDEVCRVHADFAVNSLKQAVGQFVTPVEPDSTLYRMLKIVK